MRMTFGAAFAGGWFTIAAALRHTDASTSNPPPIPSTYGLQGGGSMCLAPSSPDTENN